MKLKIRQRIPGFCSGYEPAEHIVETKEELLALPFIKQWAQEMDFVEFSISVTRGPIRDNYFDKLISYFQKDSHWVVAYITPADDVTMQEFNEYVDSFEFKSWELASEALKERKTNDFTGDTLTRE